MSYDPIEGKWQISVAMSTMLEHASENAILQRVHDEVVAYLVNDPDFRILVSEGVRETMAKLNVTEVVQAAVQQMMKEKS